MNLDKIRPEYTLGTLDESKADKNPFVLFKEWMNEALVTGQPEPTAMAVSTIGADGFPQSRIVLLKELRQDGFVFYTNYQSQKGIALTGRAQVSLLFFWPGLQRQVRITGSANRVSREITAKYFASRPRASQVGAWTSGQSREIPSRNFLEESFRQREMEFEGRSIPPPDNWGGYHVAPVRFEFWQGRENRLHDRLLYTMENEKWIITRLAP